MLARAFTHKAMYVHIRLHMCSGSVTHLALQPGSAKYLNYFGLVFLEVSTSNVFLYWMQRKVPDKVHILPFLCDWVLGKQDIGFHAQTTA